MCIRDRHKQAVLQIIKYLLGTKDLCLTFKRGSDLDLSVYTDSNYAEKADDRRSVSGVVVTLGNATVGWISSTQRIVTLSTTEAEYVALGDGVQEVLFAKSVMSFLVPSLSQKVFVDNDGAIKLASNPLSSAFPLRSGVGFFRYNCGRVRSDQRTACGYPDEGSRRTHLQGA